MEMRYCDIALLEEMGKNLRLASQIVQSCAILNIPLIETRPSQAPALLFTINSSISRIETPAGRTLDKQLGVLLFFLSLLPTARHASKGTG